MKDGNIDAARQLVSYHRDGRRMGRRKLIRVDLKKAESLFASIADKMSYSDRLYENLLFAVAARGPKSRDIVYERLNEMPPSYRQRLILTLREQDPNSYVYLVQRRLGDLGFYRGRATGGVDARTSRAIRDYCKSRSMKTECRLGPLSRQTAEVVSYAF
jgi:hypothetical protein